jgi:hypothetical protein
VTEGDPQAGDGDTTGPEDQFPGTEPFAVPDEEVRKRGDEQGDDVKQECVVSARGAQADASLRVPDRFRGGFKTFGRTTPALGAMRTEINLGAKMRAAPLIGRTQISGITNYWQSSKN